MAHFVAFCIGFQKNIPCKIPLGGGGYMAAQGLCRLFSNPLGHHRIEIKNEKCMVII